MAVILVVEDNVHQRGLLSLWLRRNAHEVIETTNGREAQKVLGGESNEPNSVASESIDLVISDVNMPEMDGIELVHWIRGECKSCRPQLPIFVLSSRCNQAELSATLADHGVRVIPKPFSPSRLVSEIEKALESANA